MNGITKCLIAVLLVSLFLMPAFAAGSTVGKCEDCQANGWGPKVVFTCAVMGDLTFKDLYDEATSLQVGAIAGTWKANSKDLVPPKGTALEFSNALDDLAKAAGNLTGHELFTKKHNELPKGVVKAVQDLKKAGLMVLTCANRPDGADKELADTMAALIANAKFKTLTFHGLYSTPATLEDYDCCDLTLISSAMDSVRLLRDELPDIANAGGNVNVGGGVTVKAIGCCSRTTRKCVITGTGNCTMCGSACCLGSTWCP